MGLAKNMKISENGRSLIKEFEALKLNAYQDSVGVWTIGWGHTKNVHPNMRITIEEAEALFQKDLDDHEPIVRNMVDVPITQSMYDALVSLVFNTGKRPPTLTKKLNSGDYRGAQEEFHAWKYAGGKVLQGLVNRRKKEASLFGKEGLNPNLIEDSKPEKLEGIIIKIIRFIVNLFKRGSNE